MEDGIYIKGKLVSFKKRDISDIFSIFLPNTFKTMPGKIAEVKYPSAFRPQRIFTTRDLSVNMGFSVFPDNLSNKDTEHTVKQMKSVLSADNPNYRFYETQRLKEITGIWFAFQSHGIDCDLYNMILITPVKQGILQSSFNCLFNDYGDWKDAVVQIWESIEG